MCYGKNTLQLRSVLFVRPQCTSVIALYGQSVCFLFLVKVVIKAERVGSAYFLGGGFQGKYVAAQLHIHWGVDDSVGSDHTFKGKHYPAEVTELYEREESTTRKCATRHLRNARIKISLSICADCIESLLLLCRFVRDHSLLMRILNWVFFFVWERFFFFIFFSFWLSVFSTYCTNNGL